MEILERNTVVRYTSLNTVYATCFETMELRLYINCLYALYMYLEHPRYILELIVKVGGFGTNLPHRIIRDFVTIACKIDFCSGPVPELNVNSSAVFLLRESGTPDYIFKEWLAYYIRFSNSYKCIPHRGPSHIIYYNFLKDITSVEKHVSQETYKMCRYCIKIMAYLENTTYKLRMMNHFVSHGKYPCYVFQNGLEGWCILCKRTPLVQVLTEEECYYEHGHKVHKCNCLYKDCFQCDEGKRRTWTRYDVPYIHYFPRKDKRSTPYSLPVR